MITKDGFKDRQLHIEDYLCEIPAERGRETGVSVYQRIAGSDDIITDFWTNNLLELIIRKENLNEAYRQVKRNKGEGGIDGMQVDELLSYLRDHQSELIQQLREGKYNPNPVRRVEIPKEGGKTRKLGIPTVVDRVVQQAIAQELTPLYEAQFSDNSFGFRPGREAAGVRQRMDKLLPTGEHEEADERNRRMAEAQNPSDVLESVETGANPVPHLSGIAPGRMAGARAVELSKRPMESGSNA